MGTVHREKASFQPVGEPEEARSIIVAVFIPPLVQGFGTILVPLGLFLRQFNFPHFELRIVRSNFKVGPQYGPGLLEWALWCGALVTGAEKCGGQVSCPKERYFMRRFSIRSHVLATCLSLAGLAAAVPAQAQIALGRPGGQATTNVADVARIAESATPMEQIMSQMPDGLMMSGPRATRAQRGRAADPIAPSVHAGSAGMPVRAIYDERLSRMPRSESRSTPGIRGASPMLEAIPQNYGQGNLDTIFHYNDYMLHPSPVRYTPYRSVGKMFFTFDGSSWYSCTAALIGRAILVTAGHCVHQGGNGGDGWIQQGYFMPAYDSRYGGSNPFGRCDIQRMATTTGWFNEDNIQQGYDVATALCGRTYDAAYTRFNNTLAGLRLGYFGFCYENCRWNYQFLTQVGYPGNYYDGQRMTAGQHLETTSGGSLDYMHGSGMRGGSSGGPHIMNIGEISDSSSDPGQVTARNVIYAVTSWGYVSEEWKIQGASPLSGVSNANDFLSLYNSMCRASRRAYGNHSCRPITQ